MIFISAKNSFTDHLPVNYCDFVTGRRATAHQLMETVAIFYTFLNWRMLICMPISFFNEAYEIFNEN